MQQPKKRLAEDAVLEVEGEEEPPPLIEAEGEEEPPPLIEAEGEEEVVSLPLRTTLFWRELSRSPGTADAISDQVGAADSRTSAWLVRGRARVLCHGLS